MLKQRQLEREAMENRRLKLYQQQRAEARAKSQEMKLKAEQRRKLDESERQLHKKVSQLVIFILSSNNVLNIALMQLEQIERDMRKFTTLRVRPLGRDRFYNKYYYFDNIGGSCVHGTSRLYVQSPTDTDILVLRSRDESEPMDGEELPCGRGGGTDFVTQLMRAQGLQKEADWLQRRLLTLRGNLETSQDDASDRWYCYSEPEDVSVTTYVRILCCSESPPLFMYMLRPPFA